MDASSFASMVNRHSHYKHAVHHINLCRTHHPLGTFEINAERCFLHILYDKNPGKALGLGF